MPTLNKIVPCLWFDDQAEQAAKFYCSIFERSRINVTSLYPNEGQDITGKEPGSVMTVEFELDGQAFTALNGGPTFKFNEAMSLQVMCDSQKEIDRYWNALGEGGDPKAQQCGWLRDQFGVSWQVVPKAMIELFTGADRKKADRAMKAMLQMKKLDIAALQRAVER